MYVFVCSTISAILNFQAYSKISVLRLQKTTIHLIDEYAVLTCSSEYLRLFDLQQISDCFIIIGLKSKFIFFCIFSYYYFSCPQFPIFVVLTVLFIFRFLSIYQTEMNFFSKQFDKMSIKFSSKN